MKKKPKLKNWRPDRPTSKGATAYHDAVVAASWHVKNIDPLIHILTSLIKPNDIVVDFGAGTGASAVYFVKNIKKKYNLILVDNSPSWLGKAYDVLKKNKNVRFLLLERTKMGYKTLDLLVGENTLDHVVSANTFHLVPETKKAFEGIYHALKPGGTFVFQSGNIVNPRRKIGLLMIDDTVKSVHDIAIEIIKTNKAFSRYKKGLKTRINKERVQRKIVFPDPRPISFYLDALKKAGFLKEKVQYKPIKVKFKDWLDFLLVRRLQAGILPEVGGKNATEKEEEDRNTLIRLAAEDFFTKLEKSNPYANKQGFSAEWTYVTAKK